MADGSQNPRNFDSSPDETARDGSARGNLSNEVLLSAYLDGECTADEQAEVESQIAANPELRQLAEELRNIRASLELLPQHRLSANFAENVLRCAERQVLTGNGDRASSPAVYPPAVEQPADPAAGFVSPSVADRTGWGRSWFWSVAALAAAILIMVFNRDPAIRTSPIARGPKGDVGSATAPARSERTLSSRRLRDGSGVPDIDQPQPTSSEEKERIKDTLAKTESKAVPALRAGGTVAEPARSTPNVLETAKSNLGDTASPRYDTEALSAPREVGARKREDNPADSASADQPAPALAITPPPSPSPVAEPEARSAESFGVTATDKQAQSLGVNGNEVSNGNNAYFYGGASEPLRVIEVLVARDAWQRGDVQKVFAKNSIELVDSENETATPSAASLRANVDRGSKEDERHELARAADQTSSSDGLQLMVVCAPTAQVEGALGELQKRDDFQVVNVTDASAPQQLFQQSARGLDNNSAWRYFTPAGGDQKTVRESDRHADQAPANEAGNSPSEDGGLKKQMNDKLGRANNPEALADEKAAETPSTLERKRAKVRGGAPEVSKPASGPPAAAEETMELQKRRTAAAQSVPPTGSGAGGGGLGGGLGGAGATQQPPVGGYGIGNSYGRSVPRQVRSQINNGRGGGGYGRSRVAGDGIVGATDTQANANLPLGYAQLVMLRQATPSDGKLTENIIIQNRGLSIEGAVQQKEAAGTNLSPAPERALFLFRVVDSPISTGAAQSTTGAAAAGRPLNPVEARGARETGSSQPVPAPGPAGGSR